MNSGFCLSWNTSGNTISLAQSAFLFSLSRRGNSISAIGIRKEACILSASLSELYFDGILMIGNNDTFSLSQQTPKKYLLPLYNFLKQYETGKLQLLLDDIFFSAPFPTVLPELNVSLGQSLCQQGIVDEICHKNKILFPPNQSILLRTIDYLKQLILCAAPISDQVSSLCYLLDSTGLWNRFFSRKDLASARQRLSEIDFLFPEHILKTIDCMDSAIVSEHFCAC